MEESPFDTYAKIYDDWYEKHKMIYESELEAIRELMPDIIPGKSLEIGVGTGRFASELGIGYGLDPSQKMIGIAGKRGIEQIIGVAEELPLKNSSIKLILMVTSLCFTDKESTFREIHRVLEPGGELIIAFIERNSLLGKEYRKKRSHKDFYRNAGFYSASELIKSLKDNCFQEPVFRQTLFRPPHEIKVPEKPLEGFGEGSFIVIKAINIKDW
ncbi:class I SAM-dependent methyltransferase [Methanolobus halotolerans]|uniref:SAM-dependent methyltransferase n=1 Tax=Methanolobus halotolerans TaxID=2052935 RepID=A0A4E0PWQ0_9EURY|nr:class I SAM-dependent methyltransferase [Methanolobus halotolerans]TGC08978.1 SAM-dependent methyltransferase [Methanolobus halotolerans]